MTARRSRAVPEAAPDQAEDFESSTKRRSSGGGSSHRVAPGGAGGRAADERSRLLEPEPMGRSAPEQVTLSEMQSGRSAEAKAEHLSVVMRRCPRETG